MHPTRKYSYKRYGCFSEKEIRDISYLHLVCKIPNVSPCSERNTINPWNGHYVSSVFCCSTILFRGNDIPINVSFCFKMISLSHFNLISARFYHFQIIGIPNSYMTVELENISCYPCSFTVSYICPLLIFDITFL